MLLIYWHFVVIFNDSSGLFAHTQIMCFNRCHHDRPKRHLHLHKVQESLFFVWYQPKQLTLLFIGSPRVLPRLLFSPHVAPFATVSLNAFSCTFGINAFILATFSLCLSTNMLCPTWSSYRRYYVVTLSLAYLLVSVFH